MTISRDQIKQWLKASGRSRAWLAAEMGRTTKTVNNWLSATQAVPASAQNHIRQLMAADIQAATHPAGSPVPSAPPSQHLVLQVDLHTFERWSRAALTKQKIVTDYAVDAIEHAAARDLGENGGSMLRAAEDSLPSADPLPGKQPISYTKARRLRKEPKHKIA